MKSLALAMLSILVVPTGSGAAEAMTETPESRPQLLFQTELGEVRVELYPDQAPQSVSNFLAYVESGDFDSSTFYRVVRTDNQPDNPVRIDVIQGGLGFGEDSRQRPPIAHESTELTGLTHQDGTLSMARLEPGTASSEFFICVGAQPELDHGGKRNPDGAGFAAFGRVIQGMGTVRSIHQAPAEGQMLTPPISILKVSRIR